MFSEHHSGKFQYSGTMVRFTALGRAIDVTQIAMVTCNILTSNQYQVEVTLVSGTELVVGLVNPQAYQAFVEYVAEMKAKYTNALLGKDHLF